MVKVGFQGPRLAGPVRAGRAPARYEKMPARYYKFLTGPGLGEPVRAGELWPLSMATHPIIARIKKACQNWRKIKSQVTYDIEIAST